MPFMAPRHHLKWVLQGLNFEIAQGEAVGIIGINGAGKSTLLKLITGTAQSTTGSVVVTGRVAALLELGMGFHPDFTGRQNALMAGQLIGLSVEEVTRLMPQIEEFAEIGEYIDQPVRVYSSGMQVRLAFSVATAVRPGILIIDEALAVGDVFFQQKCFERIRAYCQAGTTLLFVSHAMGAVYSLCNRAILISEGRIALDSTPREVIDLYNAHVLHQRDGKPTDNKIVAPEVANAPSGVVQSLLRAESLQASMASASEPSATIGSFARPGAAILAAGLFVDDRQVGSVISDRIASVRVTVKFNQSFADPHIGFQIRNARGEAVFMTNTYCMRQPIGSVQADEELTAEFSFKAAISPGEYTITAGVAEGGAGDGDFRQTLCRMQDASAFTVLKNMDAIVWTGSVNLNPILQLQRMNPITI